MKFLISFIIIVISITGFVYANNQIDIKRKDYFEREWVLWPLESSLIVSAKYADYYNTCAEEDWIKSKAAKEANQTYGPLKWGSLICSIGSGIAMLSFISI